MRVRAAFLYSCFPALMLVCGACTPAKPPAGKAPAQSVATFVGSNQCGSCHTAELAAWTESQHRRALQRASSAAVLAPFAGETAGKGARQATFYSADGNYHVRTAGPDGVTRTFDIRYTIGVAPLQQYLVDLPGGRLQAFSLAWDSRPRSEGGQRWFDLHPDRAAPAWGDPLHWSGRDQNWNFMCADCHSTDLRKHYDPGSDSYSTAWSEISVGCEACHGPGSRHADWARSGRPASGGVLGNGLETQLHDRDGSSWQVDPITHQPRRSAPRTNAREMEICARCHSRREQLIDSVSAADALAQGFSTAPLDPGLYFPDGQMRDEVYNYGSFLQSRMNARGVTCSDCHDPHSQKLRLDGDQLCSQCHAPARYASPAHHFHEPQSTGARCVACHMPARTYMGIDRRHDHSFRIPAPAESAAVGAPDVCTACHTTRPASWAESVIARRYPSRTAPFQSFGRAFAALEMGAQDAERGVLAIAADPNHSPIARASAMHRLASQGVPVPDPLLANFATSSDPLLRRAAARAAGDDSNVLRRLLHDDTRSVRLEAFRSTISNALQRNETMPAGAVSLVAAEFPSLQRYSADRPESRLLSAEALLAEGNLAAGLDALRSLIAFDPGFTAAYMSLAEAQRRAGSEPEADSTLRRALTSRDDTAAARYALGLSLARQRRYPEALNELSEAARQAPDNRTFTLVYAVALHDYGNPNRARDYLNRAIARHPQDMALRNLRAAYASAEQ